MEIILVVRKILIFGNPILREKSLPVNKITEEIKGLIKDLRDTLQKNQALGLSAPQLGALKRVIAVKAEDKIGIFINPLIKAKEGKVEADEGCMSFPSLFAPISRAQKVKIEYMNKSGQIKKYEAEGLEARAFQHEIDHLDGILCIDRMTAKLRKQALAAYFALGEEKK